MAASKYDLILTHSGTDYSYMLRQEGATKDWLISDSPLLPQTLITESASPSNLQPEREIQISQVDWRKGFQDFMLEDRHKYYESKNCDARFKGEVILSSKKLAAISLGTAVPTESITDASIESWTGNTPDEWTETGHGVENTIGGRTGDCMRSNDADNQEGGIYQDLEWHDGFQSTEFTFKAWSYTSASSYGVSTWAKISINDGRTTTSTTINSGGGQSWVQRSVTKTLAADATRLRLSLEYGIVSGVSYNIRWDDTSLTYQAKDFGAVTKQVEFGDDLVVASRQSLFNTASGSAVWLENFPATITDLCVFENRLYIALGWSDAYWYTSDLITFTESTLTGGVTDNVTATTSAYSAVATAIDVVDSSVYSAAGVYARWDDEVIEVDAIVDGDTITAIRAQLGSTAAAHATATDITELATVTGAKHMSNVGGSQFWISDTNNTMRVSDNPINDGTPFSTAYTVGSDDWDITGLVDHDEIVFCRKEDDLYYLSVADVISLLDLKSEASTTYTYGLHLWGNSLYIGSGVNSLYEYDITAGTATTISPTRYAQGDANYDEEVTAICHDETYLYIAIDNGSDIKILSGRWETVDGDTDWYWHPLYDKTSNDITCMLISSATGSKRLYAGTDTYTDGIYPFFVSVGYSAVYLESGFEAEAAGDFISPWYVSNFPTEDKFWKSVDFTSICCTDKTSITPYYQIKGGSWVAMTALTTSAYDGGYPSETTDSRTIELSSERIRFKLAMVAAVDEYTPILYGTGGGIVTYAVLQATKKRQIAATIQLAPQLRLRDDSTEDRVMATDLTNLRTLYQANAKMTLTGPDETEYDVVFARGGYQEQLGYDSTSRLEYWYCKVVLLEI